MSPLTSSRLPRSAGVLIHVTSLPGGHGIGDLGAEARLFLDWLAATGASRWQILPLVPPGKANSPYFATSSLAGNPMLLSLDLLVEDGLLSPAEIDGDVGQLDRVVFDEVAAFKGPRLERAATRLLDDARHPLHKELAAFERAEADWLEDAALFEAIGESEGGFAFWRWPRALREREPKALREARRELAPAIRRYVALQFLFERQWQALLAYAHDLGITLIGDMPIYVDTESADVWSNRDLFTVDAKGEPTALAGVPPDAFSATGQLWGSCIYRWDNIARDDYRWWVQRLRRTLAQTDIVRIDHFRAFSAYWEIPAGATDARTGEWKQGPGLPFFETLQRELGSLPIIAEDLGVIDEPVRKLRREVGLPGMKVLQFAFGDGPDNEYLPHHHAPDSVVFPGTHDNDTTRSWYETSPDHVRDHVRRYLGVSGDDVAWDFVRAAMASVADTAVVPMQDLLALGGDARMNHPAVIDGNWGWRVRADAFNHDVGDRLRQLIDLYGRRR